MKIQRAKQKDIRDIQKIENDYYGGYSCPQKVLKSWLKRGDNFLIAREGSGSVAFLFFETIDQIKALPFIHQPQKKSGKYLYVSEIGILDKYAKTNILNRLFKELLKGNKGKNGIVWVTGGKSKHDKVELGIIKKMGFQRLKKIVKWEAYPGCFISDHWIWFKKLK